MAELASLFGRAVMARRHQLNLSQAEIAIQSRGRISQTYLSEVERGIANICLDKVELLASLLRTDPATLLKGGGCEEEQKIK